MQVLERPEVMLACAALVIIVLMLIAIMLRISRRDAERDMSMMELRQAMDERIDDIRTQTESGLKHSDETLRKLTERLSDDISRTLSQSDTNQRAYMDELAGRSSSTGSERGRALSEDISRRIDALDSTIARSQQESAQRMDALDSTITRSQQESAQRMDALDSTIARSQQESAQRMDALDSTITRSQQESAQRMDALRAELASDTRAINERLDAALAPLCDRIEQLSGELDRLGGIAEALARLSAPSGAAESDAPLDALLMQWLAPGRYVRRFEIGTGSGRFADFAIIMPEENGQSLYLPVDSSFPCSEHAGAWDDAARRSLGEAVSAYSRRMASELIKPGLTCDMAIMLIQSELVSARVSELEAAGEPGLRDRRVLIMGPGAFGAMVRMLEGGINALTMQRRSAEIEHLLSDVRQELGRFARLMSAHSDAQPEDMHNAQDTRIDNEDGTKSGHYGAYAHAGKHAHKASAAAPDNVRRADGAAGGVRAAQSDSDVDIWS